MDAENISGQAKEIISAALERLKNNGTSPVLGDPNVTDNFKGLPMRELIAAPLIAAAEAQQELAATAWNFYQKIAFDEDGKTARVLEFDIKRPIQQDGKMTTMSQSVKAPFIGLVPIPSLLIDRVDVDFQMEVTDTSNVKSTTNAEVETKASAKTLVYKCGNQRQSHDRPREHPHDQPNGKITRYMFLPASSRRPKVCLN